MNIKTVISNYQHLKTSIVVCYHNADGFEPVKEWLEQVGWPNDVPLCRSLGDDLWDFCGHLAGGRVARIFFCNLPGLVVLLHAAIFDLPVDDQENEDAILLARSRMREIHPREYLH